MKSILFFIFSLTLVGCASGLREYSQIGEIKKEYQSIKVLADFPFVLQEENYCGPATLSMAFKYYDHDIDQEEISKSVFLKEGEGTYQTLMLREIRKNGFYAININHYEDMIKEINNDSPVIVFHNLGFDWYPLWHYAIVYGYDLDKEIFYVHSAAEKAKEWEMDKFERSWRRGDNWAVVVNPVDKLSLTGSELEHMRSAAFIESFHGAEKAKIAYQKILEKWPNSLMANMGLGNVYLKENNKELALKFYLKAQKIDPENKVVKNNISYMNSMMQNR